MATSSLPNSKCQNKEANRIEVSENSSESSMIYQLCISEKQRKLGIHTTLLVLIQNISQCAFEFNHFLDIKK